MFFSVPTVLRIVLFLLLGVVGLGMASDIVPVEPETTPFGDEYQTTDELESVTTPAPPSSSDRDTTTAMQTIHRHTPAPDFANADTAAVVQHSSGVAHGSRNVGAHVRGRTVFITFVPGALLVFCIFAACLGLFANAV
jgi:hypothetical protein